MTNQENNALFLEALFQKNYTLVTTLLNNHIPSFIYDKKNNKEKEQFSMSFNTLKLHLRHLYIDGQFDIAGKLTDLLALNRDISNTEATLNYEDIKDIAQYLITKKSPHIHFFWPKYFQREMNQQVLINFILIAIKGNNYDFLSPYDNLTSLFDSPLILQNVINISFSKPTDNDFFKNLQHFYTLFRPQFNFNNYLSKALQHQILIRTTENIHSPQFKHIEHIYSIYFPENYSFKLAHGLQQSLKKKSENECIVHEYIQKIFQHYTLDTIKKHGKLLFTHDPQLKQKFTLFSNLSNKLNKKIVNNKNDSIHKVIKL